VQGAALRGNSSRSAAAQAHRLTKVFLVHVAAPDPSFVGNEAGREVVRDQVAQELRDEQRSVHALAERLRDSGVIATGLLIHGPTVETVLQETARLNADLIAVGIHGRGTVCDMLVGSIGLGVRGKSPVPVVVVPARK